MRVNRTVGGRGRRSLSTLAIALLLILAALTPGALTGCGGDSSPGEETIGTAAVSGSAGDEIKGSWEGELRQRGLKPFRVRATIASLEKPGDNTVHYTGIDCGGHWSYISRDGHTYRFHEVIDSGEGGKCKGTGTVTLTPTAMDTLEYTFVGGGIESRGVLTRTS